MFSTIHKNRWFLIPYFIVVLVCLGIVLIASQASVHLYLNKFYSNFTDVFFKYITHLGDGLIIPFLVLLLIFIRLRHAFFLLSAYVVSGFFTQILKRSFFSHAPRPTRFFEDLSQLHLVPGVEQLSMKTFPSGHATTAFAIMICFALISKNNLLKLLFFILGSIIAYSRVYLSQHFLTDILAGSFIGVMTGLWLYQVIYALKWEWLDKDILHLKS